MQQRPRPNAPRTNPVTRPRPTQANRPVLRCPQCGSTRVNVQFVQDSATTRTKKSGCLWTLGRWMLIICTAGLWLLVGKRKSKGKTQFHNRKVAVCGSCGHSWDI